LELDTFTIELDGANLEVDTDGGYKGGRPGVVTESKEKARFADACAGGKR
jgi:hypothetical protein